MNNILDFSRCSNCGACYNACPVKAINVDESDFFYKLRVDEDKCTSCGLCKKVCPVNNPEQRQNLLHAYAAQNMDSQVVKNSSSGGFFHAIATYVLGKGGVVFGAAYEEDMYSVKMTSTDKVSLDALMRSKYVESKVGFSFKEVKELLLSEKTVLYCGAPCQIAGLKRYLGKEYDNLITCDFSCEGFASHEIYKQYIEGIEKKLRGKVKAVNFRAKLDGWMTHSIKIDAENGRSYKSFAKADPYFYSFLYKQMGLREYCMECDFAANHYADIVIADFWAYKRVSKVENDNTGLSLVIANSKKGENVIETLQKSLALTELCLEDASYNMKERNVSEDELSGKRAFISECQRDGFMNTAQKRYTLESNTKMKVRSALGKIKRLIK